MDRGILMLAKAFEIKRLPVDQELAVLHFHRPDAKGLFVDVNRTSILMKLNPERIEVGIKRLPKYCRRDPVLPPVALELRYDPAGFIDDARLYVSLPFQEDFIIDNPYSTLPIRNYRNIFDIDAWCRI